MSNVLTKIISEAKRMRKAKPNSKKQWKTYVKEAAQKVKSGKVKRKKSVKKPVTKRKRKVSSVGKVKKPVYKVTHKVRRVGSTSGLSLSNPLVVGAIALAGFYLWKTRTRKAEGAAPSQSNQVLPPLNYTADVQRNMKMDDLLRYATAIGLAGTALTNFIKNLNSSSTNELEDLKNNIDSGAGIPSNWV